MARNIGTLEIDIRAELGRLQSDMDKMRKQMHGTFSMIEKGANALKTALAGTFAGIGVHEFQTALAGFDKLDSALTTTLQSSEAAAAASKQLLGITEKYKQLDISELTQGYINLRNAGIEPTEKKLISFYNILATKPDKNLDQLVQAVADVVIGQTDRLAEFGIKAKQEQDKVTLSFGDFTSTVGKNAQEIGQWFEDLGNTKFAGGLENQLDDIDTAMKAAEKSSKLLMKTLGDAGGRQAIIEFWNSLTGAVGAFDRQIKSLTSDSIDAQIIRYEDQLASAKRVFEQLRPMVGLPIIGPDVEDMARREAAIRDMERVLADLRRQREAMPQTAIPPVPAPADLGKSAAEQAAALKDQLDAIKAKYDQLAETKSLAVEGMNRRMDIEKEAAQSDAIRLQIEQAQAGNKITLSTELTRLKIAEHQEELKLITDVGDRAKVTAELNNEQARLKDLLEQSGQSAELFGVKAANAARDAAREFRSVFDSLGDNRFDDVLDPKGFLEQRRQLLAGTASGRKLGLENDLNEARDAMSAGLLNAKELEEVQKAIADRWKETNDGAAQFGQIMTSAFEDAVLSGNNLSGVLKGLATDMARLALRNMLNETISPAVSQSVSWAGTAIKGLLGFAEGGDPPVGVPSIVGERGPELFIPKVAGTIVPTQSGGGHALAMAGTMTMQVNITNQSGQEVQASARQTDTGDWQLDIMLKEKMRGFIRSGTFDNDLGRIVGQRRPTR